MARWGRLRDLVTWDRLLTGPAPTVLRTRSGMLCATLTYTGADTAMLDEAEHTSYLARLNTLLMRLGTGWSLLMDEWCEPTLAYPTSRWHHPTACFVDASRRSVYASADVYESQHFLTIGYLPPAPMQTWATRLYTWCLQGSGQAVEVDQTSFVQTCTRWADGLTGLVPSWHWLSPRETLTYLHRCISWDRDTVQVPEVPIALAARLSTTDFVPGYLPTLGSQLLCPVEIQSWPQEALGTTVPTRLHDLGIPYRFVVRYLPLDRQEAAALVRTTAQHWRGLMPVRFPAGLRWLAPPQAGVHADSVDTALEALHTGATGYGYTAPVVLVWGPHQEVVETRARAVRGVLGEAGLVTADSHMNSCQAWLGTLPGDVVHNVRQPLLPSQALATLVPMSTIWAGPLRDTHYDAPALLTTTSDGMAFRLVLHPDGGELGNLMVVGPSRSGKSGLLGVVASQFQRYAGAQTYIFDKDEALYGTTLLHGGTHLAFDGDCTIAPLALVDGDHGWAAQWVGQVLTSALGRPMTPDDHHEIGVALHRLASLPPSQRTLTTYGTLLQDRALSQALRPYQQGGLYAFCDAAVTTAALTDWTTIEMRHLLALPEALPHVLRFLFHQIDQRLTGAPTLIILDEAWRLLADPVFRAEILHWLKECAKKNVSVILSTQEVQDAALSAAWQALLASCQAWVYLANPAALKPDVAAMYRLCGLSERQIQLLSVSTPRQDYLYVSPQGSRRFQVALSPLERALVAPSTLEEITRMRALALESSTQGGSVPFVATWLAQDAPDAAQIFHEQYERPHHASL